MRNFLIKLIFTAITVILIAEFLPGVHVEGFLTALLVALLLAVLNAVLKPVLIVLTIPITILTLGLFLLVINTLMVLLTDYFIDGFEVSSFWWALIFSLILSFVNSVIEKMTKD